MIGGSVLILDTKYLILITMLKILFVLLLSGFVLSGFGQSVDSLTIKNIDGANVSLLSYMGSKTLFLIAPSRPADSAELKELAAFNVRYGDTIKIVGILSFEDGYVDSNKMAIKAMYQHKGINLLLTEGMYTKKSAANQSALMKFLTWQSLNKRVDDDAMGRGHKFFVNENGKLYATLIPQASLFSAAVKRIVERKL